jgi:hypothetical protein
LHTGMKNEPQMTIKTRKLVLVLSLIISYVALRVDGSSLSGAPGSQYNEESIFECFRGHYRPNLYCHFRPGSLLLDHAGQFEVLSQQPPPPLLGGDSAFSIWDIKISNKRLTFGCNVVPEPVIIFTIHYDGSCNHFHLHYDTLLPLFALLEKKNWLTKKVLLMPTVENSWRGEPGIAWDTAAFRPEQLGSAPFLSALRALAFAPDAVVPLSSEFLKDGCHLFSNEVIFGVPKLERTNEPSLLERFVQHMQLRLGIVESSHAASLALDIKGGVIPGVASALPYTMPLRAAFISRRGRRRVLNEDELVGAVNESGIIAMDKIDFEGMTFKDQVKYIIKEAPPLPPLTYTHTHTHTRFKY